MNWCRIFCICFIMFFCPIWPCGFVYGQSNIRFNRITYEDGLSQNSVYALIQDRDGFIWMGTSEGLNVYDGYSFKVYKPNLFDSTSISDTWITALYEDSQGLIWVGTFGAGIDCFDKKTEKFTRYKNIPGNGNSLCNNVVYSFAEDKNNLLWIGTDEGISIFNRENQSFIHYRHLDDDPNSLSYNAINQIYIDRSQRVWVCTDGGGLDLFDDKTQNFIHYQPQPGNRNTISGNSIWQITEDPVNQDIFWIATFSGLEKFDFKNSQFTHFNEKTTPVSIPDNRLRTIFADTKGRIWMGTQDKGLCYFDTKTKKTIHFINNPNDKRSLSNNQILCMMQDKSQLLWIGTRGGGADIVLESSFDHYYAINNDNNSLVSNVVWSVFENGNELWIGTNNGLTRLNLITKEYRHFQKNQNNTSINDYNVYALFLDRDGDLWIGTSEGGLNFLPRNSDKFKYFMHNPDNANSLPHNYVRCITQDKNGLIWIGTRGGGICSFDKTTGTFTRYRNIADNLNSLSHNRVNALLVDFDNHLWIGTSGGGLNKFDIVNKQFTHYNNNPYDTTSLSDIYVLSLFQSHDSTIWVGTYNGGLNALNIKQGKFSHYTQDDGLPNNVVYGILEDKNQDLWISTNRGLCRFNPHKKQFKTFDMSDGIQGFEFNTGSMHYGKSGTMYFGGTEGLNAFKPEEIKGQTFIPPVCITGFKIFDQPVVFGKNNLLKKPLIFTDTIHLDYHQSIFSISFSSLHFLSPGKNQYSFILENFENQWNRVGNIHFARYSNVPPGAYIFKVKGTNNDGIWNENPTQIVILIHPPYWKTLWFRILMIIIFLLAIYVIIIIREQNLRRSKRNLIEKVRERTHEINQQKEEIASQAEELARQNIELEKHRSNLEQLVKERTAELEIAKDRAEESDRLKSAFLANMSHEVRTPMNAIIGFSSLLIDEEVTDDEKKEYIRRIIQNGSSLMNLIDDIVNISIIESGQLKIFKQNTNINQVIQELIQHFIFKIQNSKNQQVEIRHTIHDINKPLMLYTDGSRLKQILTNLIDNAVKYTEQGTVTVGYEEINSGSEPSINFFVRDTGIGMTEKQKSKLFERFSKADDSKEKLYRGAGLGLSVCKNLVELLGGKIHADSELNAGSTFYFSLPYITSQDDMNAREQKPTEERQNLLKGKTILIAEDEEGNFRLLEAIFSKTHSHILHASNGLEAVNMVKNNHVDLILMDVKMPVMNGLEATKIIKSMGMNIPVIAQTAFAFESDEIITYHSGCDAYISKPIHQSKLIELVTQFIK